jgi:hypothetical protein
MEPSIALQSSATANLILNGIELPEVLNRIVIAEFNPVFLSVSHI